MKNKKIVIAGGSGFIGHALCDEWGKHNQIIVLSRQKNYKHPLAEAVYWDGQTLGIWQQQLEDCDLLVNLAGKSVNCRYTPANKKAIFDSRTDAVTVLGAAIQACQNPPKVFINAASATIYAHSLNQPMTESQHEIKNDFSVQVCKKWEACFTSLQLPGTRKVILRIAVTFGRQGGVFGYYLNLVKCGLGGKQGNGEQMFSWVHARDVARMMEWVYETPTCQGVYNCAAPYPERNRDMMKTLRAVFGHKFGFPLPTWTLKIGAFIIGTETELLLKSRYVLPKRAMQEGFKFQFPAARAAFENIKQSLPRSKYHLF